MPRPFRSTSLAFVLGFIIAANVAYSSKSGITYPPLRVQDEGSGLVQRYTLNFSGAGVSCVDDTTRTTCTISGGAGGKVSEAYMADASITAQYLTLTCGAGEYVTCSGSACTCSTPSGGPGGKVAEAYMADAAIYANIAQVAYSADASYSSIISGTAQTAFAADASITTIQFETNPSDCSAGQYATTIAANGNLTCAQVAYSQLSGTPTIPTDISGAGYITKTAEANLSNEFALGSLATGVLVNTTTTGIPTIKGANTCTNQFPRSDNASGVWTCASVALGTDTSGTLPIASGGTNGTATPTGGGVAYGTGTAYAFSAAGSAGDCLKSGGGGAPTWGSCSSISAYGTVQEEGASLTQRTTLNFIGSGITCVDNAGSTRTDCTVSGGSGQTYQQTLRTAFLSQ